MAGIAEILELEIDTRLSTVTGRRRSMGWGERGIDGRGEEGEEEEDGEEGRMGGEEKADGG